MSMTKIAGSGSISQRHGSEDPDPDSPQNVMDPQHWVWHRTAGKYHRVNSIFVNVPITLRSRVNECTLGDKMRCILRTV
jgi:hypothetical protein